MSIFNYDQESPVDIRPRAIRAREYWVWNPETKDFDPLGGSGGSPIPYWAKPNSVEISGDGDGDAAVLGAFSLTVQRDGEQFHLTPSGLAFMGTAGTNILTSQKTKLLTQLKTTIDSIPIGAGSKTVVWNPTTQAFSVEDVHPYLKTDSIDFGGGGAGHNMNTLKVTANGGDEYGELHAEMNQVWLKMGATNVDSKSILTESSLTFANKAGTAASILNRANLKQVEDLHTMLEAAPEAGVNNILMGYNPTTKKLVRNPSLAMLYTSSTANLGMTPTSLFITGPTSSVNITPTSLRVGPSAQWILLNCTTVTNPMLSLRKSGTTLNLEYEDILTTNNLKALTAVAPGVNSKMVVYDSVTKAFNHATIPSGGSVPGYVQPTKLVIPRPNPADIQTNQIDLTNVDGSINTKLLLSDRSISMYRTDGVNPDKGADIGIDQFIALAGYNVPKTFYKVMAPTAFQNCGTIAPSMPNYSAADALNQAAFYPSFGIPTGPAAPFFNLLPGQKLIIKTSAVMDRTQKYGIRFPIGASGGQTTMYRFRAFPIGPYPAHARGSLDEEPMEVVKATAVGGSLLEGTHVFSFPSTSTMKSGMFHGHIEIECVSYDPSSFPVMNPT